jgi:mono/diheme cytochrome c family protein
MRKGVDPAGQHFYPAFPYDHFTRVTDDDDQAIYAYLMTREPVRATPPANDLPFPLNRRGVMAAWNRLFFDKGEWRPDRAHDAAWNRGAYLIEGLGHCGACHTPHNWFGAEEHRQALAGAPIERWYALPLNADSPAPIPWTTGSLAFYLKHGWAEHHGVSRGPMQAVTASLADVPDADITAMAAYVIDRMGPPSDARARRADALLEGVAPKPAISGPGAAIYAAACAGCHESGRPLPFGGIYLALSSGLTAASPANAIQLVLDGLPATPGIASPIMPGFAAVLSDQQLVDLLTYLRAQFTDQPAWSGLDTPIHAARQKGT